MVHKSGLGHNMTEAEEEGKEVRYNDFANIRTNLQSRSLLYAVNGMTSVDRAIYDFNLSNTALPCVSFFVDRLIFKWREILNGNQAAMTVHTTLEQDNDEDW